MLVLLLAATLCPGQGTFMVKFEGPPILTPGQGWTAASYVESGMNFYLLGSHLFWQGVTRYQGPYGVWPDNGTAYLVGGSSITNTIAFSQIDSALFNLFSVDLSPYAGDHPPPATVQFVGYRSDGSVVATNLIASAFNGVGVPVFETFYLSPDFYDLIRVEIPSHGWCLDNLVFSVIPEPSVMVLFSIGGLLFLANQVRKRRSRQ